MVCSQWPNACWIFLRRIKNAASTPMFVACRLASCTLHFADNSPDIYHYKGYPSLIHLPPIILLVIAQLYASVDSWTIVEVPLGQTGW